MMHGVTLAAALSTIVTAVLVALSVIAHELAHGYAALLQGDRTAQRAGRLTWNPLVHLDPLLTVIVPAIALLLSHGTIVLGGARAVPVNPRSYRDGVRGDLFVSLAGIIVNVAIALLLLAVSPLVGSIALRVAAANVSLALFNLLPIPPLDGWRVARCVRHLLRERQTA